MSESSLLLSGEEESSLVDRLKLKASENFDPVPPQLLRKYIGYARKYVHPTLSEEAADVLQVGQCVVCHMITPVLCKPIT